MPGLTTSFSSDCALVYPDINESRIWLWVKDKLHVIFDEQISI